MELVKIEKLLEKYENAESTLQEEQVLKEYFQHNEVPVHLQEYKALFNYFNESKAERYTKTIPLKNNKLNWKWLSVAATVLLMIGAYTFNKYSEQQKALEAYQGTQQALQLISQNLNRGENVAIAGLQEFKKTQQKVFKITETKK